MGPQRSKHYIFDHKLWSKNVRKLRFHERNPILQKIFNPIWPEGDESSPLKWNIVKTFERLMELTWNFMTFLNFSWT